MTATDNFKEEKKANQVASVYSKRYSWNSKRKYGYKYVTSVF
ncbi:hypothetical protein [Tenacibaculum sp. SDUM215027]